jgi:glycerate-2-kinase
VVVIAIGKAADPMARAAVGFLGSAVAAGVVVTKDGHLAGHLPEPLAGFEAAHPVPDERGAAAAEQALALVRATSRDDLVLALVSGGGSALFEAPRPPATLADVAALTDLLLRAGAPIQHLNAVRTPLSQVKGGGFRAAAPHARFATLVLSDVLGNDLRTIASGPTIPGVPNPERALDLLDRYRVRDRVPSAVLAVLCDQQEGATGPVADTDDVALIVGDNAAAVEAARAAATADGFGVKVIWTEREGEARELGREWVAACRRVDPGVDVVLGGGEATVTVLGGGLGGRNTEFALAAAGALADGGEAGWAIASLASDGQDGLTGAAGAIVDSGTSERTRRAGIDPARALAENDSATALAASGDLLSPGPTGTNVCDLYFGVRIARD